MIHFLGCYCNKQGAYNDTCNEETGNCLCKPEYSGNKCEKRKFTQGKQ